METLVLSGNVYFTLVMKVKRNIYRTKIVNCVISKAELKRGCTLSEGWGIQVKVHNDQSRLVKISNILDHPHLIQFWMNGKHLPPKLSLLNVRDVMHIGPTAATMLDELHGNPLQYCAVPNYHDLFFGNKRRDYEAHALKNTWISTREIVDAFTLANDDEAFFEVRAEVDQVMSEALFTTYGQFSE